MSFASMPLYTGDYLRDTRHLTPMRHGVYLLALFHCWDSKGPMPLDEQECAGICNCRSADEVEALRYVLGKYFILMSDGHYNKRISVEIAKWERVSKQRSDGGLRSAEVRRNKVRAADKARKTEAAQALRAYEDMLNTSSASLKDKSVSPSPSPSLNTEDSVPNGTGSDGASAPASPAAPVIEASSEPTGHAQPAADPPPEPTAKDRCWALGVGLLVSAGVREPQARSMLGLWMRDHGADALHAALADCAAEQAIAPVAWLQARLGPSVRRGARPAPKHAEPHWRTEQKAKVARIMARGAVALGLGPDGLMDAPGTASVTTMETIDADHDTPRIRIAGR